MTSWKDTLQIGDLDPNQRLEMTCKRCGHVHYLTAPMLLAVGRRATLYLDEVERHTICRERGCKGSVRMALSHRGDASGFVGGMA
ncbi:MAG: hypothetical protein ABL882_00655 [Sphingopyxis sp.]